MSTIDNSKYALLKTVQEEVLSLKESPLYAYRIENKYHPVFGEGDHNARIVFVGEAPGKSEATTGKPFCGRAGKILDELLLSIGLPRESVYITNIVKDRPPKNRDPHPEEINLYGPFLAREISIIQPKVIAALGRFSASYLFTELGIAESGPISSTHGRVFEGTGTYGTIHLVPLYHPAAAIYNQSLKGTLIKDFQVLKQFIS